MSMQISVVFANPEQPLWLKPTLAPGSTVGDAIACSGLLDRFPHLDLGSCKTGIFGKFAKLDKTLEPGDRVEIYLPATADPKAVKRRKQSDTQLANAN